MTEWLSKLQAEWSLIETAPISFIFVLSIVIVTTWAVINLSYRVVLLKKNATIKFLQRRVAAYQNKLSGASPDEAEDEINKLRADIEAIKNPSRNDALYQNGRRIGFVAGINVGMQAKVVTFRVMTIDGELYPTTNVEFRNLILLYTGSDNFYQMGQAPAVTTTYRNVRFSIVENRYRARLT